MKKLKANDLLESLIQEFNQDEVNEIYKALIAYSIGIETIDEKIDKELDKVIDFYWEADYIPSILNDEIRDFAKEVFNKEAE